jgi:hypothetical protein
MDSSALTTSRCIVIAIFSVSFTFGQRIAALS